MTTSKTPLLRGPLEAAVPERVSLRLSYLYYGGTGIAGGGIGLVYHARLLWLVAFAFGVVAFLNPRRIDVDGEWLVLVPLFGFPKQRIPLAAVGRFELRGRFGGSGKGVTAVIRADIGPAGYLAPSLSRTDLVAALETSRETGLAGTLGHLPARMTATATMSPAALVRQPAVRLERVPAAAVDTPPSPQQVALRNVLTTLLDEGRALAAEVDAGAPDPRVEAWIERVRRTLAEERPGVAGYVDALGARTYADDADRLRAYLGRLATVVRDFV